MTKSRESRESPDEESSTQLAVRLPNKLLSKIEDHRKKMARSAPGMNVSRVDAIRNLLTLAVESQSQPTD